MEMLWRGLERGVWGWCEGDGKVGFCCFVKLGGVMEVVVWVLC